MSLPTMSGTARLVDDIELRFAPSGTAVAKVRLAFNSRKLNQQTQQWEDDATFFINGVMFKQAAENASTLTKGTEVVVTGRLKTDQWEDKQTGEKRSAPSLLIDSLGPAVNNFQTVTVTRAPRSTGDSTGSPTRTTTDDPWSTPATAGAGTGFADDSAPPF